MWYISTQYYNIKDECLHMQVILNILIGIQTDDQTKLLCLLSTMTIVETIFLQVLLNVIGTWLVNYGKYLVRAGSRFLAI